MGLKSKLNTRTLTIVTEAEQVSDHVALQASSIFKRNFVFILLCEPK